MARAVAAPDIATLPVEIESPRAPDAAQWAVLHAPWELLADRTGFLAQNAELRYAPARPLGAAKNPPVLDDYRLGVAFMASAPQGAVELDFEGEEAAIMTAAESDTYLLLQDGTSHPVAVFHEDRLLDLTAGD